MQGGGKKIMTVKSRIFVSVAAVALAVVALAPGAAANCVPAKVFGQVGVTYTYVFMPATSTNTFASIIGTFWEVGAAATDNNGACTDDSWFPVCNTAQYACGGNPTGKTRYMNGAFGGSLGGRPPCTVTGCPAGGDLNTLIQDTTTDGKIVFALARVSETPAAGTAYDYSRISNITPVDMPRVTVNTSSRVGTTVNLNLNLSALNGGFFGLAGQTASGPGNISGYRINTFTGTADPGRLRTLWTPGALFTYTGSAVNIPTLAVDCTNTATDVFVSVSLEFDSGTWASDYTSQSVRVECNPTIANPQRFRSLDKPSDLQKAPPRN
jgi:hypothetical protein